MSRSVGEAIATRRRLREARRRAARLQRRLIAAAVGSAFAAAAFANPTGGSVVSGSASIVANGKTLTITNAPGTIINWQQFSISQDEITRFIQQNANSAVLNRVVGQDPTQILGQLLSNGRVYLINPNGLVFGKGAVIDVAGFAASTLNLSNADFLSGRHAFTGAGTEGKITNLGTIKTQEGGHVYLVAPSVENAASGVITSPKGEVVIAAGKTVELVNARTPDIRVEFTAPATEAVNAGQIVASSGRIGIYGTLVKNSGLVSASRAESGDGGRIVFRAVKDVTLDATSRIEANGAKGGSIELKAETGTLVAQGVIEAKGEAGKGGDIALLGNRVAVNAATVDASGTAGGGTILVGGDFQGKNPAVQNAQRTIVTSTAQIRADATGSGDGGKVILWADGDTRFYGTISAKGGPDGGNGGFVEVSGKEFLAFAGMVDTTAPRGLTGTLLLDPTDITITNNATVAYPSANVGDADGDWLFADDPGSASISSGSVVAILNNTNVNFQASGNITILDNANISYSNTPARDFTLTANESIIVGGGVNISSSGGALNVRFVADNDANSVGGVQIGTGGTATTISTNGGNLTLGGAGTASAFGTAATANAGVRLNKVSISTGAGDVTIRGQGRDGSADAHGVRIDSGGSTISTTTGSIVITGTTGNSTNAAYGVFVNESVSISANGGAITITGSANGTAAGGYGIYVRDQSTIQSNGAGDITLTGTGSTLSGTGVFLGAGTNATLAVRTTSTGNIVITGTSGATSGNDGYGVGIANRGTIVESTGTGGGTITITGNGGAGVDRNYGVFMQGAVVRSKDGAIVVSGTSNGTGTDNHGLYLNNETVGPQFASVIEATGSANLTINATAGTGGVGIKALGAVAAQQNQIGNASASGAVTLVSNTMDLNSTKVQSGSTLTLRTSTASREIEIGAGANETAKLGLAGTEVANFNAPNIIIGGGAQAGNVTVVGAANFANAGAGGMLTLQTTGTTNVAASLTAPGNITVNASNGIVFAQTSGTGITTGSGKTANLTSSLGSITSVASTGNDVSTGGAAGLVILSANGAIGSTAAPVVLDTGNLTVTNAGTGDVAIQNQNSLTFNGFVFQGNLSIATVGADTDLTISGDHQFSGGTAKSATFAATRNVLVQGGANIRATAAGALDLTLNADSDATSSGGVKIGNGGTHANIVTAGGNVLIGGGASAAGTAYGTTATDSVGVKLDTANISTGAGSITMRGRGEDGGTVHAGVLITRSSVVQTTSGAITITGTGGNGSNNDGIVLYGSGSTAQFSRIVTATGAITLVGQGGNAGGADQGQGIVVFDGSSIQSTGATKAGIGNVSLTGTGGNGASAMRGIQISGGNVVSVAADIFITGTGGNGTAAVGVMLGGNTTDGEIKTTGTGANAGNITINGTAGGAAGAQSFGFGLVRGASSQNATISTVDGHITIAGTSTTTSSDSDGIFVGCTTAVCGAAGPQVSIGSTGNGTLTLTGSAGGANKGIYLATSTTTNHNIGSAGGSGAVTLIADTMQLDGGAIRGAGTLTLRTQTASRTIELGSGANETASLGLNATELGNLFGANIVIGGASQAGNLVVVGASSFANAPAAGTLTLQTLGVANIGSALSAPGNVTVNAANGIAFTHASGVGITTGTGKTANLTTSLGAITSVNGGNQTDVSTGANGTVTMSANTGIGSTGNAVVLDTGNLAATNSGASGDIVLSNANAITLGTSGTVTNAASGGNIDITVVSGNLTVADTVSTAGNGAVVLTASAGNIVFTAANIGVNAGSGNVTLTASNATAGGRIVGTAANLNVVAGLLTATANSGIGEGTALRTSVSNVSLTNASGNISVANANKALNLDLVTGGNAVVALTITNTTHITQTGNIVMGASSTATFNATTAGDITLTAAGNDFANVTIAGGRNVSIKDANALTLNGAAFNGNLALETTGASSDLTIAGDNVYGGAGANTATFKSAQNILMLGGANIRSTGGALDVTLNADTDNNGGGVQVGNNTTTALVSSAGGNVLIGGGASAGNHAIGTAGTSNIGVYVIGANIDAGAGSLTIRGRGAASGGDQSHGVLITGNALVQTTGAGDLTISGIGDGTGALSTGVEVRGHSWVSQVWVRTTGAGNLSITGTGATNTDAGAARHGVSIQGDRTVVETTGAGNISITGQGGNGGGGGTGVVVGGSQGTYLRTTSSGKIVVQGTGGNASGAHGVWVNNGASIEATGGSAAATIDVTGNADAAGGVGVFVDASGQGAFNNSRIYSTAGNITIVANGGGASADSDGLRMREGNSGLSNSGAEILSTGAGHILITASTANANAAGVRFLDFSTSSNRIGGPSATGNLTVVTNSLAIDGNGALQTTGSGVITLRPQTASRAIEIGSSNDAGALAISGAEAGQLLANFVTLGGAAQAGNVSVVGAANFANMGVGGTLTLQTLGVANIGNALSAPGNVTVNAANGIAFTHASGTGITTGTGKTANLTTSLGSITSTNGGNQTDVSTGANGSVTMSANTGIGSTGNAVVLDTGNLSATNSGASGDIVLSNANAITLGTSGTLTNAASGGNIDITVASGNLTVADTVSTAGNGAVALTASSGNIVFTAANVGVNAGSGNVTLTASNTTVGGRIVGTAANLNVVGGLLTASANAGIGDGTALRTSVSNVSVTNGLGNVSIANANKALNLDSVTQGAGNLTVTNTTHITQTGNVVMGAGSTATFNATTTGDITLSAAGNDFSTVVIQAGREVALRDGNAVVLGASTISGNFAVTAGGDITQTGNLVVNGAAKTANFQATGFNVNVGTAAGNDFNTVVATGSNVTVSDINALVLGNVTATGNLTVTIAGALTQAAGANIVNGSAGSVATFNAGTTGDITLNASANNFNTVVIQAGREVTLRDTDALILGASTITGNLLVTAGGDITQSGNLVVNGSGTTANFQAVGFNVNLGTQLGNDFNTVAVAGLGVTVRDQNAVNLGNVAVTGNLLVTAGGAITQSGNVVVNGAGTTANFQAAGFNVNVGTQLGNDFNTVVATGANVTVSDTNALILGNVAASGNLAIVANGAVTQASGANVSAAGNANFSAGTGNLTLDATTNNFGTLTFNAATVVVNEASDTQLTGNSAASGNLTLTTTGNLAETAQGTVTLSVGGNANLQATAGNITLTNTASHNFGTLTFNSGTVAIHEASDTQLTGNSAASGNLTLTTTGNLSETAQGTVTLAVGGNANLQATAGNITLTNTASHNFGTLTFNGGTVALVEDSSMTLTGASAATGNLNLTSAGFMNQTTGSSITGNSIATFNAGAGNDITFNGGANNFGSVAITAGNSVTIFDASALVLSNSTVSGNYLVVANGAVTTSGTLALNGANSTIQAQTANSDLTISNTITHNGGAAVLNLRADGNVAFTASGNVASLAGALDVTLNSNRDGDGGAISMASGSRIVSNGGNISLVGGTAGADAASGVGTAGISMNGATLSSSNGLIVLRGNGGSGGRGIDILGNTSIASGTANITLTGIGGTGGGTDNDGISVVNSNVAISGGSGILTLTGNGGAGTNNNSGIEIVGSNLTSAGGAIVLSGNRGTSTGSDSIGIFLSNALIEYSGAGTGTRVQLTGAGGAGGTTGSHGIRVSGSTVRNTGTGDVVLDGTGTGTSGYGVGIDGASNVTAGAANLVVVGTGAGASGIDIGTGSTIGGAAASGNILLRTAGTTGITIAGNIQTTAAGQITFNTAAAGANQSGGAILGNGNLRIVGTGTFNLNIASNNIAVLAADVTGNLGYTDADSFVIGTISSNAGAGVTTTNGITITGTANGAILSTTGNVTQTQAITAPNLLLLGTGGNYQLNGVTTNNVGTLAANTGTVSLVNNANLVVGSFTSVQGTTTNGTTTTGNIVLDTRSGGTISVNQQMNTSSGGVVTFTNDGLLTINANISADGALTQNGAGAVAIVTPRAITTSNDAVHFTRNVTLSGSNLATIDTGTSGGNVTFNGALNGTGAGAESITIVAGTTGNVQFNGTVGATQLGALQITSANNVTSLGSISANTVTQNAGSGTTMFNNTVTVNGGNITISANAIVFNSNVSATGQSIHFNATAGGVTQNGGTLSATNLRLLGAGTFNISSTTNNVGTLAAAANGGVLNLGYVDTNDVVVGNVGATVGITTSNGNVTIRAGSGGAGSVSIAEQLNAGTGNVTLTASGNVSGGGVLTANVLTANATGGLINLANAQASSFNGLATGGNITVVNTKSSLTITSANASGLVDISTSNAMVVTGNVLAGAGSNVSLTSGTGLASDGGMNIGANITGPAGVTLTVRGDDAILNHTAGNVTTTNANISLVADEMYLQSGANTIRSGSANITVRPFNAGDTIQIGRANATDNLGGANTLEFSASELNALGTSNTLIVGGASHNGAIQVIGTATVNNATGNMLIHTQVGNVNVNSGTFSFAGASGNLAVAAPAGAITAGGGALGAANLSLTAQQGIASNISNAATGVSGTNLSLTNTGTGAVTLGVTAGDLLVRTFNQAATGTAQITMTDGSMNTGTSSFSAGGAVKLVANATGTTARTITVGAGGISAAGQTELSAADGLTINGNVVTTTGNINLVSGTATGMSSGATLTLPTESSDTTGPIDINAVVKTSAGNITIYSSGAITQPNNNTSMAGLQSTGQLTVRTFSEGSNGAPINLQNTHPTWGNSNPDVVLEARRTIDTSAPSEPSAAVDYAASDIDYKSITGLSLKGIGTAANYTATATTQSITVATFNIQAKNLTLIANAGDINVNASIEKSKINRGNDGGSLNLLAAGDINLNANSAVQGVSIGKRIGTKDSGDPLVEYFNHDLRIVSTNNINIQGGIWITGNLSLRADASAAEVVSLTGALSSKALGDGVGGVSVTNPSTADPLEIRALNVIVGEKSGTTYLPVQFLKLNAGSGTAAAGANLRLDSILRAGIPDTETLTSTSTSVTGGRMEIILSGGMNLTAGSITGTSTGGTVRNSSFAAVTGKDVYICHAAGCSVSATPYDAANSIRLQGGTATANNVAGGGAVAAADAFILASNYKTIVINGDLILVGGTATRVGSGQASATALIDPVQELVIRTGGSVVLQAGTVSGGASPASAAAKIVNEGFISIFMGAVGGYTFNDPTNGAIALSPGLILIGSGASGLFDGQNLSLPGTSIPITLNGGGIVRYSPSGNYGPAFVQSGVKTFDESLLRYLIFSQLEAAQSDRIRRGLGEDDLGGAACQ